MLVDGTGILTLLPELRCQLNVFGGIGSIYRPSQRDAKLSETTDNVYVQRDTKNNSIKIKLIITI